MNVPDAIEYLDLSGFRALPASRAKKHPMGAWGKFRNQEPSTAELAALAQGADAVCMLMGSCSGNAETLDFDNLEYWEKWRSAMRPELLARLLIEVTQNGGHHVIYRCSEIEGNQKLAMERWAVEGPGEWPTGYGTKKIKAVQRGEEWVIEPCLIETRGEGGLIICSPSPGYTFEQGDPLTSDIEITVEERAYMLALARSLSKVEVTERPATAIKGRAPDFTNSPYPRDQYNQTAELDELLGLLADGEWKACGENSSGRLEFTRPGKDEGVGGTLTKDAPHIFYNFSDSAGLPARVGLPPFDLLVAYGHGGDRDAALADLKGRGFEFIMPEALGVISAEDAAEPGPPVGDDVYYTKDAAIELLNKEYAQTTIGKHEIIIRDRPDFAVGLLHPAAFKAINAEIKVELVLGTDKDGNLKTKRVHGTDLWRDSAKRRKVEGLKFDPTKTCGPNYVNIWRGFDVKPKSGGSFRMYRDHVEKVICSGDPILIKYVWAWIADIFQNPGKKPGVALALKGERGVGKGVFVTAIKKLIGKRHALQTNDRGLINSPFNSQLEDKILVFLDEAFWAGDKNAEGRMKGMITEEEVNIERKGIDRFSVKSYHRYIMASNEDWFIKAGRKERRYCVMNVPTTNIQDRKHFAALFKELKAGGYEALMHWLLELDISDVDLGVAPKTDALMEQALESASPEEKWWVSVLQQGYITKGMEEVGTWPKHIGLRETYHIFRAQHDKQDGRAVGERTFIAKVLKGLGGCSEPVTTNLGGDVRQFLSHVPRLEVCRKNVEVEYGAKIKWAKTEEEMRLENEFPDL